jgi:SM-20-related protein
VVELLEIDVFLDDAMVDRIRGEMRAAQGHPAALLGATAERTDAPSPRRATRIAISDDTRAAVVTLLERHRPRMEDHFARPLDGCEEPQFLCYQPGDYFVPHQDGNTPLVHDESRFRKVSVVILLSAQSERPTHDRYCGGSLVLHGPYSEPSDPMPLAPAPGTLVAFPSETTHEVTPITHGERLSVVSWYRSESER